MTTNQVSDDPFFNLFGNDQTNTTQTSTTNNDDPFFKLFGNTTNTAVNQQTTTNTNKFDAALFPDFMSTVTTKELINKQHDDENDLKLTEDTKLPINKCFRFKNIYINNCAVSLPTQGVLELESLNDIIIENATIDLKGKANMHDYKPPKYLQNKDIYGKQLNQIYIGDEGKGFEGGGMGGCGLKLSCKKQLIIKNSIIDISGAPCCAPPKIADLRCGPSGDNGSCLIICNDFIMDKTSKIKTGRVVLQINSNLITSQQRNYLIYGYWRNTKLKIIDDVCKICNLYAMNHFDYAAYDDLIKTPVYVDDKWKEIKTNINTDLGLLADIIYNTSGTHATDDVFEAWFNDNANANTSQTVNTQTTKDYSDPFESLWHQ